MFANVIERTCIMNKTKHRSLSMLLIFAMFVTLLQQIASGVAVTEYEGNGWFFAPETGTLTVSTDEGATDWRWEMCVDTLEIQDVKSVIIQDGVTSIGDYAFSDCTSLAVVVIPNSVTNIGIGAFRGCISLASIIIPDSVTGIGSGAFSDCISLSSIWFGGLPPELGDDVFLNSSKLRVIYVPIGAAAVYREILQISAGYVEAPLPPVCMVYKCNVCYGNPNAGRHGDVTADGVISTMDALEIYRFMARQPNMIESCVLSLHSARIVTAAPEMPNQLDALEIFKYMIRFPNHIGKYSAPVPISVPEVPTIVSVSPNYVTFADGYLAVRINESGRHVEIVAAKEISSSFEFMFYANTTFGCDIVELGALSRGAGLTRVGSYFVDVGVPGVSFSGHGVAHVTATGMPVKPGEVLFRAVINDGDAVRYGSVSFSDVTNHKNGTAYVIFGGEVVNASMDGITVTLAPPVCDTCGAEDCKINHAAQPHRFPCQHDCGNRPTVGQTGHVLGYSIVTTEDALEILRYVVKLPSVISKCENARKAASIMGDTIATADALEILKKIVKLPNRIDGTV